MKDPFCKRDAINQFITTYFLPTFFIYFGIEVKCCYYISFPYLISNVITITDLQYFYYFHLNFIQIDWQPVNILKLSACSGFQISIPFFHVKPTLFFIQSSSPYQFSRHQLTFFLCSVCSVLYCEVLLALVRVKQETSKIFPVPWRILSHYLNDERE